MLDDSLSNAFLDPGRHRSALHVIAARYLERGDVRAAYPFGDRLCRITSMKDARALVLRARISRALDEFALARADRRSALAIDPTDPVVLEHVLLNGEDAEIFAAASLVLASSRSTSAMLGIAVGAVGSRGYERVTALRVSPDCIAGWVAWRGEPVLDVSVAGNAMFDAIAIEADGDHPVVCEGWHTADIDLRIRTSDLARARAMLAGIEPLHAGAPVRCFRADRTIGFSTESVQQRMPPPNSPAVVTVIVPLFDNVRMTTLCLTTLGRQSIDGEAPRVILIQDNPRLEEMTGLARRMAARFGFELIENVHTFGFAAAINRALSKAADGDVVLLNSDVVLPPDAIERLRQVARSAPDIGTVTPLSNNGEEASFPSPFHDEGFGTYRHVCALNDIAAEVNGQDSVTLVNGIGFCLYVTRAALDAVALLPELYDRGYYEDVDFCLALRTHGLRNVCAPGVYVGHRGASSFKDEKRALVMRNQRVIEQRYPTYPAESAAFLRSDPLQTARARIERRVGTKRRYRVLLFIPPAIASQVVRPLVGDDVLTLSWAALDAGHVQIQAADGTVPQSLGFASRETEALAAYLRRAGVETLRLFGPCAPQADLIDRLQNAGFAVEMLFEESLLQVPPRHGSQCEIESSDHVCRQCAEAFNAASKTISSRGGLGLRLKRADRIVPTNPMADATGRRLGFSAGKSEAKAAAASSQRSAIRGGALGILAGNMAATTARFVETVCAGHFGAARLPRIVLLGETSDDLRFMASGHAFVTGPVAPDEIATLVRRYDIGGLFAPHRWWGYGELVRLCTGLPTAYFDWSGGSVETVQGDLALDPRLCDRKAALLVTRWFSQMSVSAAG